MTLGDGPGDGPPPLVAGRTGRGVEELGDAGEVPVTTGRIALGPAGADRDLTDGEADEDEDEDDDELDVVPAGDDEAVVRDGEDDVEAERGGDRGDDPDTRSPAAATPTRGVDGVLTRS